MNKKIKQKLTSFKNYVKNHKSMVSLAVLLVIAAIIYWWVFHPHNQDRFGGPDDSQFSPAAAAVLDSWHGTVPSPSTIFQRPAGNVNWQQMNQTQRQQMWQQRMATMEAFSMAFAHAPAAQQQAIIDQMKQGFGRMGGGGGGPGGPGGGPGGPGGPGGRRGGPGGNRGTPNPQMAARRVANQLLSNNPQMSAARNEMRMAMEGSNNKK